MRRTYRGVFSALIVSLFAGAHTTQARLPDARISPPDRQIQEAVHLPTGCEARIELLNSALVMALIVDPECLPQGVAARPVPASLIDFERLPKPR